jgi:Peptidase family M23
MRTIVPFVIAVALLTFAGAASGYPWPVRPFHQQHPIRANFGDPRTVFQEGLFSNGIDGSGIFLFHNGVDISAPDGTAVYPVVSGTVSHVSGLTVTVRANDNRAFMYVHIAPLVIVGERVIAQQTTLGYIAATYGHVHLTEIRGHQVWNPLARGGIAPYEDLTNPTVRAIYIRHWNSLEPLNPNAVCGKVSISADAYDTHARPVRGAFAGFPVSPALVTWSVTRLHATRRLAAASGDVDFRTTLPRSKDFWSVYARGTYQNGPRFGRRQYVMAGLFMFQLTRQGLETRDLPNGTYRVSVRAFDIKGNEGSLVHEFRISNDPTTATGCRPPVSTPPSPPPSTQPAPAPTTTTQSSP